MKHSYVLMGLAILFASCSESTKKTPNGFEFKIVKEGEEDSLPSAGQIIIYNLRLKDSKDSTWADTYERGLPERTVIGDAGQLASEDGITQMFRQLSKGDSATFNMPTTKFFRDFVKSPIPPTVDSTLTLYGNVKVDEVLNQSEFETFRQKIVEKYVAKQEEFSKVQLGKDTVAIDQFLNGKGLQVEKLPSGIRYIIKTKGAGPLAVSRQKVSVNYDGYLLNDTHFDTNVKSLSQQHKLYNQDRDTYGGYKPFEVVIDSSSVIVGWHMALKQLNEGAKGTFYIPSSLAYGQQGSGIIKSNEILVFDIELIKIE